MESICAALGHQSDLRARALPLVGAVVGGGYTKFLNGILRYRQHGGERVTVGLVVHVHAVQRDVALIAARAIYRSIPGILIFVADTITRVGHPRLQAEQVGDVAALKGELLHLYFVKRISDRS